MTDRKKPGVAFWTTVTLVVLLVGYPLAIGPCMYATERWGQQSIFEYPFFKPAFIVYERLPGQMKKPVRN